jgi:hypothetical protein
MPSSVFLTSPVDDVSDFICLEGGGEYEYNEAVGHIDLRLHVNEPFGHSLLYRNF